MQKHFRLLAGLLYVTPVYPIVTAQTTPPAKDRMVTVGRRQIHALVDGHGGPAVILEAGFVNDLRSFGKISRQWRNSQRSFHTIAQAWGVLRVPQARVPACRLRLICTTF